MTDKLRVAIIGAGTCGVLMAASLLKHQQLEFQVYESQSEKEFEVADGHMEMGQNAVAALKAMGLDQEKLFADAGAKDWEASRCIVGVGEHKGDFLIRLGGHGSVVLKRRWHQELVKLIPSRNIQYEKKLVKIDLNWREPRQLRFEDGSTSQADVVIGGDGMYSIFRYLVLERQHQRRIQPCYTGYWEVFGRTSRDKAAALFGPDLFPFEDNEITLTLNGAAMSFRSTGDPEKYDISMTGIANRTDRLVGQTFDKAFLERIYPQWDPSFIDAVANCLLEEGSNECPIYPERETQEATIYFEDPLCMIGDTAHKMSPWSGSNAGLEIEDVAVVTSLLGALESRSDDIKAALLAFDQTRRGRPEQLRRRTHLVAKIMTGQLGLDPKPIAALHTEKWWEDRDSLDIEAHICEALAHLEAVRKPRGKDH